MTNSYCVDVARWTSVSIDGLFRYVWFNVVAAGKALRRTLCTQAVPDRDACVAQL